MAWQHNKKVRMTYTTHHSQNSWALIDTVGWRKIKPKAADGVSNLSIMMSAAKANDRLVSVFLDDDNQITTAYLR